MQCTFLQIRVNLFIYRLLLKQMEFVYSVLCILDHTAFIEHVKDN